MSPAKPAGEPSVEPITPDPVRRLSRTLLTQSWLDVAFLHWAADPADVAPLLPAGTVPDTHDGRTYIGLVAFRMHRVGWFGLPGVPCFGTFPETNVRLYAVDRQGRRAVVFLSLEASRLLPVAIARAFFQLPYFWARMEVARDADTVTYRTRRRLPGPRGTHSRISVRVGEPIAEPTPLEHFLTARWGMHHTFFGRSGHLPDIHPRWPLHRAELLGLDDALIPAAGLPAPGGPPLSVLWSPGVRVRFGRLARAAARA
ncbi:YqjF family protein [Streptomyces evansiae]|uniref:YqjF family protein n=1 Tax=Streptomyces evansiae TaxID=3075535 RepID=UPI0028864601|nr:DUF2071 domain-containing protein [Streptomyces sp. DSM 41859]MDT0422794.1 DUF2071 domain-containing protein [Streptomyces sp. DSM 41859]